jgi:hypothetical protein
MAGALNILSEKNREGLTCVHEIQQMYRNGDQLSLTPDGRFRRVLRVRAKAGVANRRKQARGGYEARSQRRL